MGTRGYGFEKGLTETTFDQAVEKVTTELKSEGFGAWALARTTKRTPYDRLSAEELSVDLEQGETLLLEKLSSLYTSRDPAISECELEAEKAIARARRFDGELADHVHAWERLWHQFEVNIEPADHAGMAANL